MSTDTTLTPEQALHHARSPFSRFVVMGIDGCVWASDATDQGARIKAAAWDDAEIVNAYDVARPLAARYAAALLAAVATAPTISAVSRLHAEFADMVAAVTDDETAAVKHAVRVRMLALSPARPAKAAK